MIGLSVKTYGFVFQFQNEVANDPKELRKVHVEVLR